MLRAGRSPLPLKVGAGAHEGNALVHHPFADVEVPIDNGPDLFGLYLLGFDAEAGASVSAQETKSI